MSRQDANLTIPEKNIIKRIMNNREFTVYDAPYENLYETLAATAKRLPEKIGLIDADEIITYRSFLDRVDAFAWYLQNVLKVKKGERVALMMFNSISFCVAFYATTKIGCIISLINTKLQSAEIEYMLNDTGAETLVLNQYSWYKIQSVIGNTNVKKLVFDLIEQEVEFSGQIHELKDIYQYVIAQGDNTITQIERDCMLPAVIIYTSGSSGTPKGAVLSHLSMLETIYSYEAILKVNEKESALLAVPIFHVTGLSCIMALFIYSGGLLVMIPKFNAEEALEKMAEYQITHFHAVPTVYTMLINAMKDDIDLSHLSAAVCGGGYIKDETMSTFCKIAPNVSFHPAYGMTETAGGGVLFPEHYFAKGKSCSAGKVMPNIEVMIVDDNYKEVPIGETGQICFRGSMVTMEYWNQSGRNSFIGEWLLTGDVGRLDKDNYIYIEGRIKSMINRGGEKIYSKFVEKEIENNNKVKQAVVFPVKDTILGEVPGTVIIPEQGIKLTVQEIVEYLQPRISRIKIPQYIEFREELPYTASGKIKIVALVDEFNKKYYM